MAKRLKEARGDMTQADVAKRLGWTQSLVCKLESGFREPSALELWGLAKIYRRPLSFFFLEKGAGQPLFVTEESVAWHVAHYGYNFLVCRKEYNGGLHLSPEETILAVLQWFPDPRLMEAIPVLLYVNDIDADDLYERAWKENLQNRLGFIASVTIECIESYGAKGKLANLLRLKKRLEPIKLAREDSFQEKIEKLSEGALNYLRQTRDPIASDWNILDRLFLTGFKEIFSRAILAKAA